MSTSIKNISLYQQCPVLLKLKIPFTNNNGWNKFARRCYFYLADRKLTKIKPLPKIFICGIGNRLKRDDGIGSYVIQELKKRELPENITMEDFGISGFKTALEIGNYDKVIFVDAIQSGKKPGELYKSTLNREEFLERPSLSSCSVSLHESDLEKILSSAAVINTYPKEVVIIGCEPKDLSQGLELSDEIKKGVSKIIDLILEEII